MIIENLSTLKIHEISEEQYKREKEKGNIDPSAVYLTPYGEDVTGDYAEIDHTHEISDVNELQELINTSAYIDIEDNEDVNDDVTPSASIDVDDALSDTSENPVQNKVISLKIQDLEASKLSISNIDNALSDTSENPVQNKVISLAIEQLNGSLLNKVDKENNKGLSTNDFTNEYKDNTIYVPIEKTNSLHIVMGVGFVIVGLILGVACSYLFL